jgi:NTE family protein
MSHVDAVVGTGGGSRGSWQAGAALAAAEILGDDFRPTIFRGTSTGAIGVAGWACKPTFLEGAQYVVDCYHEHVRKTSDVWRLRFPFGIPGIWNPSFGTAKALRSLLGEVVDLQGLNREGHDVKVSAVDVLTGKVHYLPLGDRATVDKIMASASFPMFFEPIESGERWFTDGGVRDIAPLGNAIRAGATRILLLGTNDPAMMESVEKCDVSTIVPFGKRIIDIQSEEILKDDIAMCRDKNRLASVPRVLSELGVSDGIIQVAKARLGIVEREVELISVFPSKTLGSSLDFTGSMMDAQIEQGMADAKLSLGG